MDDDWDTVEAMDDISELKEKLALQSEELKAAQEEARALRDALIKILKVSQFGRPGSIIVESKDYEAAWLDCIDIAREALAPRQGESEDGGS